MTADLVARLRHWSREDDLDIGHEAADEIERANLARLQAIHERDCAVEDVARLTGEVAHLRQTLRMYGITPARVLSDDIPGDVNASTPVHRDRPAEAGELAPVRSALAPSGETPGDPVADVGPAAVRLGYCNGIGADGVPCFVRNHCMHHMHPDAMTRTIDPPFRWWLSDHNRWEMECDAYVVDVIAVKRFPYEHRLADDVPDKRSEEWRKAGEKIAEAIPEGRDEDTRSVTTTKGE